MYKIKLPDTSFDIHEDYEGEAMDLFNKADIDAGDLVDVLYVMDTTTDEMLEIWRKNWM